MALTEGLGGGFATASVPASLPNWDRLRATSSILRGSLMNTGMPSARSLSRWASRLPLFQATTRSGLRATTFSMSTEV
jgi:hypothetical protein